MDRQRCIVLFRCSLPSRENNQTTFTMLEQLVLSCKDLVVMLYMLYLLSYSISLIPLYFG